MTIKNMVKIECPRCGLKSNTRIWDSLNTAVNPEDKQILFDGRVNLFKCKACDLTSPVEHELLFHEQEQGYIVYLFPLVRIQDPEFIKRFVPKGRYKSNFGFEISDEANYFNEPHFVFNMQELIDYVKFRDKLFKYMGSLKLVDWRKLQKQ